MTATDRSTAPAADFDARLAVWEAATPDPDGRVEIVARALEEACVDDATWTTLAVAALAAAPKVPGPLAPATSDPTAALRRVEALADDYQRIADEILAEEPQSIYRERVAQTGFATAARIRRVLSAPAGPDGDGGEVR